MSGINALPLKLIPFVLPSSEKTNNTVSLKSSLDTGLSGSEVSQFYESVICSTSRQKPEKRTLHTLKEGEGLKKQRKSTNIPAQSISIKSDSIFLHAQQGDISQLKQCVENGISINQQDAYGWTPIMCAACEGHLSAVQYLLKVGANVDMKCKYGMTVMDIAKKSNNSAIIKLLLNRVIPSKKESSPKTNTNQPEVKFCSDCKVYYKTSNIVHERSIAHLLVKSKSNLSTFYHIPENNKGFQIMLKSGWDKNKGLGPNADGRKFPIKTVFKQDRSCIGKKKEVSKVTHFIANDETAVHTKTSGPVKAVREKTLKKWERKKLDAKNRQREIDFRRSFNTDY